MISKDTFLKRIKFLTDYKRFLNRRKHKKPVTLEEIEVPVPDIDNKKFKK